MILLSLFACHHPVVVAPPPAPAWDATRGLRGDAPRELPRGPLPGDRDPFTTFESIEQTGSLGSRRAVEELVGARTGASQTWLAASLREELSAGLVHGNVRLVLDACDNAGRVTDPALHRRGGIEGLEQACHVLGAAPPAPSGDKCAEADRLALEGWAALGRGDEATARSFVGDAVAIWRKCPTSHAVWTAPADPNGLGFLTVLVAQIVGVPEDLWLRGQTEIPSFSARIDARWVELVTPVSHR